DEPGGSYWKEWKTYIEQQLVKRGMISPDDMNLFTVTDQVEEAVKEIANFYRVYHSARHVDERLVIRLNRSLSPDVIERLNSEFRDILTEGKIEAGEPQAQEIREKELLHLPRLLLKFNRTSLGRLRQLINAINQAPPSS
ncbi:MAG TPA: cytochrome D ubiquinol oxidase subunit II, partial [Nitrospiria bacterium]|nr:cytochrome D ubiquinol oxidase subunit II [Nitrospiria bacterium]